MALGWTCWHRQLQAETGLHGFYLFMAGYGAWLSADSEWQVTVHGWVPHVVAVGDWCNRVGSIDALACKTRIEHADPGRLHDGVQHPRHVVDDSRRPCQLDILDGHRCRQHLPLRKKRNAMGSTPLFPLRPYGRRWLVRKNQLVQRMMNFTGMVYCTDTALPRCWPGSNCGKLSTTRTASLSRRGSTSRSTFTSFTLPFLPTTK